MKINYIVFSKSVDFSNTEFTDEANFANAVFNAQPRGEAQRSDKFSALFSGAKFRKGADFYRGQFGTANFSKSEFNGKADFSSSYWFLAIFRGSKFFDEISFIDAKFVGDAIFKESYFAKSCNFNNIESLKANFSESEFAEDLSLSGSKFKEYANFGMTQFGGYADFRGTRFLKAADFNETKFNGNTSFSNSVFKDTTNFAGSNFLKSTEFVESQFVEVKFNKVRFSENADFAGSNFRGDTYFMGSLFGGDASFERAQFSRYARFDSATFRGKLLLTQSQFEKFYVRWSAIEKNLVFDDTVYLILVDNYKKLGLFEDADRCYYKYRITRKIENSIKQFFDSAARLAYGYGVKPENPLIWSACIIFFLASFFFITGDVHKISGNESISFGDALSFSTTTFTSGASNLISPSSNYLAEGNSASLVALERLLGWLFFGLFLASLGRTVIR